MTNEASEGSLSHYFERYFKCYKKLQEFLLFEDGMIVYQLVGSVTIRDTIEMDFFCSKSRD